MSDLTETHTMLMHSRGRAQALAAKIEDQYVRKTVEKSLEESATLPDMVKAFHILYGMPITAPSKASTDFSHMSRERLAMRFALIAEEFMELCEAMDVRCDPNFYYLDENEEWQKASAGIEITDHNETSDKQLHEVVRMRLREAVEQTDERNIVEVADALGDLKYVIQGFELEVGIPSQAVLSEIQSSNMSKLGEDGNPIYRDDGKVLKGPHYFKPNVAKVLSAHGMKLGNTSFG